MVISPLVVPASGPRATGLGRLCCWSEPQATGLGVRLRPSVLFSGLNHKPQGLGFVCDRLVLLSGLNHKPLGLGFVCDRLVLLSGLNHKPMGLCFVCDRLAGSESRASGPGIRLRPSFYSPARKERISACIPSRRSLGVNPFVDAASRRTVSALR